MFAALHGSWRKRRDVSGNSMLSGRVLMSMMWLSWFLLMN